MARLILYLLLLTTISCSSQTKKANNKIKIIKKYDYCITIGIWNDYSMYNSKYILNNLQIDNYDSSTKSPLTRPLILYHIAAQDSKSDTTEILFSKAESDKLFNLTNNFFKSFLFKNYDTSVNNVVSKTFISDDSGATIELQYGGRTLKATISSISNQTIATHEFDALLKYIDRLIVPETK